MVTNPYQYTAEKLTATLECLVVHTGDARERLGSASQIFHVLSEKDFPLEHQSKWKWVMTELTKFGPIFDYKGNVRVGSVDNTMKRIKKKTASNIIKVIYELYC